MNIELSCLECISKKLFPNVSKNKYATSILLPHAGLEYSGLASVIPFLEIDTNKYSNVVCLCTNHYSNDNITINNHTKKDITDEHSYLRMKEIVEYFFRNNKHNKKPNFVKYHLIGNHNSTVLDELSKNTLIIANSDLWHYGSRFNNAHLSTPELCQITKVQRENNLIKAIKNSDYNKYKRNYRLVNPCGNQVIQLLLKYHKKNNIIGQVCMYYDSVNLLSTNFNILDVLKIDYNGCENLVSYVSIIFSKKKEYVITPLIHQFEKFILLSRIKSVSEFKVNKLPLDNKLIMPIWCNINTRQNGIFVGIKDVVDNSTRASIGYYSSNDFIHNTLSAAESCVDDAANRWGRKLSTQEISPYNKIMYYINIFQNQSDWKEFNDFENLSKSIYAKDKKIYGYQYRYNNDIIPIKSTYLPGVWYEHRDRWPSFIDMINDLIKKAFNSSLSEEKIKNYRDNGIYKVYETSYTEEPILQNDLCCIRKYT